MALIHRNGNTYHYTTRREGHRVVREYGGYGRIAILGQQLEDATRKLRRHERIMVRDELFWFHSETIAYGVWFQAINRVIGEALERSGWHCVRRQWRRKRGATMNQLVSISQLSWVPSELAVAAGAIDSETTEKAKKGDIAALKAVDAYLANPAAKACWGDMGRFVFTKWAEHLAGKGTLGYHALIRFASDMRTNLAGPNANALDWLLAERVVVAWLFVQWSEWQYAGQFDKLNLKQSAYYIRRNEMANRNLMSACRTLAKVKRAKLPDVLAVVSVKAPRTVSTEVESAKSHI